MWTISPVKLDLDGNGTFETAYTTTADGLFKLKLIDEPRSVYTVAMQWMTPNDGELVATLNVFVGVDGGLSINDGEAFTNDLHVRVALNPQPGVTMVRVSNDGGFRTFKSYPAGSIIDWKLDGSYTKTATRVVYLKYVGQAGQYTDDIVLDRTKPLLLSVSVSPGGARSSSRTGNRVTIETAVSDTISGVIGIQITSDRSKPGKVKKYRSRVRAVITKRVAWVRVQDRAGNFSIWKKART